MGELELPAELTLKWLRTPITGCMFAEAIAKKPDISPVRLLTVRKSVNDPELPAFIDAVLLQASAEPVAVLFIFPDLRVDEDIADLVMALVKHQAFTTKRRYWPQGVARSDEPKSRDCRNGP